MYDLLSMSKTCEPPIIKCVTIVGITEVLSTQTIGIMKLGLTVWSKPRKNHYVQGQHIKLNLVYIKSNQHTIAASITWEEWSNSISHQHIKLVGMGGGICK